MIEIVNSFQGGFPFFINTIGSHRVIDIGDGDNFRQKSHIIFGSAQRIALGINPLMVKQDRPFDLKIECAEFIEQRIAVEGMKLNNFIFLLG